MGSGHSISGEVCGVRLGVLSLFGVELVPRFSPEGGCVGGVDTAGVGVGVGVANCAGAGVATGDDGGVAAGAGITIAVPSASTAPPDPLTPISRRPWRR